MDDLSLPLVFVAIFGALLLHHVLLERPRERRRREALATVRERGVKPLTRHPQIDRDRCLACGSCIAACPETHGPDSPLALVYGRLELANPLHCVGHATCEAACPVGAITVGLGVLADDPDMPPLAESGESALVPGLFLAGELTGLPLIRNAIGQGKAAIEAIAARLEGSARRDGARDVAIIGIGPAGFAATLAAHERGLDYVAIEQGVLGGTVASYPRRKLVLTSPVDLPLFGPLVAREIQKEELLDIWRMTAVRHRLRLRLREKVDGVARKADGTFELRSSGQVVRARAVVLALGRRGTPRKLGVPGEDRTNVTYSLTDPYLYRGEKVLVVGGGDSAVEAALALAPENRVTLAYRGEAFFRLKARNQDRIASASARGEVDVRFGTTVGEIRKTSVVLRGPSGEERLENDRVIVLIGGEAPTAFLRAIGVVRGARPEPQPQR